MEMIQNQNAIGQPRQPTVVTIASNEPPVRDHLTWSIFNTIYMNVCCLGLVALVYSVKTRDQKLVGDKHGASNHGLTARNLNIAATVVSIILFIILIALYAAGFIAAAILNYGDNINATKTGNDSLLEDSTLHWTPKTS